MRNNAFFKFLALLLCALSLFGTVAAAAGVVVLAQGDLYNKSVDQMLFSRLESDGTAYADYLARQYTSVHLGGIPEDLADRQFGNSNWFYHNYDQAHYGYAILDASGNELYGYNVELKDAPNLMFRKEFPVEGRYMHLLSLESQEENQEALRQSREAVYAAEPTLTLHDKMIPSEGVVVDYVSFLTDTGEMALDAYYNGNSVVVTTYQEDAEYITFHNGSQLGLLMFDQTRHLVFHSFFSIGEDFPDYAISEVFFQNNEDLNLRLRGDDGCIGTLYRSDSGNIRFLSAQAAASSLPEETVPETTAATVPETVPETVPPTMPETLPPETWVEETWAGETGEPSSASAVPEGEGTVPPTVPPTEPPTTPPTEPPVETTPPTLPPETTVPAETLPPATEPELINGKPLAEYQRNTATYWDRTTGMDMEADYIYLPMPELTVELYLEEDALRNAPIYDILRQILPYRNYLLPAAAGFALLFVLFGIYLITAAGRRPKQEGVRAGGLNRLPLDLYFLAGGSLIAALVMAPLGMSNLLMKTDFLLFCGLTAGGIFLACLVFVGFCFAWAAQWKTGGNFVWKNSLCAWLLAGLVWTAVNFEQFLATTFLPASGGS